MSNDIQEALGMEFNPEDVDTSGMDNDFQPLKPAWYPAEIEHAEVVSKEPDKSGLKLQFVVLGDAYSGRKVFGYINLKNPSTTCENIGKAELATLCTAVGCPGLRSTDQLLTKTLMIKTAVKAAVMEMVNGIKVEKYKADTEIKEYKAPGATTGDVVKLPLIDKPPVAETVASAPKQEVTGGPGKMPWE